MTRRHMVLIALWGGCTAPPEGPSGMPADCSSATLGEAWGDLLFITTHTKCVTRTTVHRLPSLEVVGTWVGMGAVGRVRPVGDLDDDGVPEQVYTGIEGGESVAGWLTGLPSGDEDVSARWVWHARSPLKEPVLDVLPADLDGDGAMEIGLWGTWDGPTVAWQVPDDAEGELDTSALETVAFAFTVEPRHGLLSSDIDDDGVTELISRTPYAVQEGPLGLTFAPSVVLEGVAWLGEEPADLTGDGVVDVLLKGTDEVLVLDGTTAPSSAADLTIGWGGRPITGGSVLADIDGDGFDDMLVLSREDARIYRGPFEGFSDASDAEHVLTSEGSPYPGLAFVPADLDGDGRDDLVEVKSEWDGRYELSVHLATDLFP